MTNEEVARAFVHRFCAGDLDGLAPLLDERLHARGPLHEFHSRDDYLAQLHRRPPPPAGCDILSLTRNDNQVCVIYRYGTSAGMTLVQLFTLRDGKIVDMLVVFDTATLPGKDRVPTR